MKRVVLALAALALIAATPEEVLPGLEANGYYIEDGSTATEQLVSDAVFEGRADGGRLYIVILADEPPGGATTFSDSTLDLLDGSGYVLTVAPETVGYAGDGSYWARDQMEAAVDASWDGGSDDRVVDLFVSTLTGAPVGGNGSEGETPSDGEAATPGGFGFIWLVLIAGGVVALWIYLSKRNRQKLVASRLNEIRKLAKAKLDEVANDILEMEDEVAVSDNPQVKEHYQRASVIYSEAIEDNRAATTVREMLDVSEKLDLAIWELDSAEALLDGKPMPAKPEAPRSQVVMPAPTTSTPPSPASPKEDEFDRRPQRQSTGSNDMLTMLMTMMAMGGMRSRGPFGGFGGGIGGFGGGGGGGMRGGGLRGGGGGRMRGGGHRGG